MAKKLVVNQDLCIGCGTCAGVCPSVFKMEDGKSQVIVDTCPEDCNCQEAVESCPVSAISIEGE